MSATPLNLGVAAPSSTPPAAAPAWPDAAQLPLVPVARPTAHAASWPRSALWATVVLLVAALGILAWNVYASGRWATRPTTLEPGALQTSRINLNQADRAQLMQLHGVGDTLATRIIAYRDEHHGFRSVDELRNVQGIGPVLIEKLRPHVYVEVRDDEEEAEPPEPVTAKPAAQKPKQDKPATSKKSDELKGRIDVNRASAEELQRLPRVGPKLAERIIEARQKTPFKKIDDLRHVSGIGAKTLDGLRPFVTVGEAEPEKKD